MPQGHESAKLAEPTAPGLTGRGGSRVERIDRLLPQTQCRRCGYDGCRPYAEAIDRGEAVNRCPPGGDATLIALGRLLGIDPPPLDQSRGLTQPRRVASIDNSLCIGCTKCIRVCPVDAIIGAPKHQHHVIADRCTGCDLCLPPCPADCISMTALETPWSPIEAARGRTHHQARLDRLAAAQAPAAVTDHRDPLVALGSPAEKSRRLDRILQRVREATRP